MLHFRQGEGRVDTWNGFWSFRSIRKFGEKIQSFVRIRIQEMIYDSGTMFWGLGQGWRGWEGTWPLKVLRFQNS